MRTIRATEPTSVLPARASIFTSPLLTLGFPNLPATKNDTEVPLVGTDRVRLLANDPVAPFLNTTVPPPAAEAPVSFTLTLGEVAPDGLVTRIRHGDGAHVTKRASGLALLLICSSTSMVMPPEAGDLSGIVRRRGIATGPIDNWACAAGASQTSSMKREKNPIRTSQDNSTMTLAAV